MKRIALLGIPNDDNSSYLRGAAEAPARIRAHLFCDAYSTWSETGFDLGAAGALVDHGDLRFDAATDPWEIVECAVANAIEAGDPLLCLGGDHAITHPILRGVRRFHPRLSVLHIDAHPDIYENYQGNPRSHASPFARIMEERLADRLVQVGLRTINDDHRAQFARYGVEVVEAARCDAPVRFAFDTPVYLSIDIDALDPAYAPGVSHREPGGISVRRVVEIIQSIDRPIVGADIVEFNPRCDIADLTVGVAAKLVKEVAGVMARNASRS